MHAAIVHVTYTGTVPESGEVQTDYSGVFGAPGSLVGKSYSAEYIFDTAIGSISASLSRGGTQWGGPTPNIATIVTVGGVAMAPFVGTYESHIQGIDGGAWHRQLASAKVFDANAIGGYNQISSTADVFGGLTLPTSIDAGFTYTLAPGDSGFGFFAIFALDQDSHMQYARFAAAITSMTVEVEAVPLPPAWPMLLLGVLGYGLTTRRRCSAPGCDPRASGRSE